MTEGGGEGWAGEGIRVIIDETPKIIRLMCPYCLTKRTAMRMVDDDGIWAWRIYRAGPYKPTQWEKVKTRAEADKLVRKDYCRHADICHKGKEDRWYPTRITPPPS